MNFYLFEDDKINYKVPSAYLVFENHNRFVSFIKEKCKYNIIEKMPLYDDYVFERAEIIDLIHLINAYFNESKSIEYLAFAELMNLRNLLIIAWNNKCSVISVGD